MIGRPVALFCVAVAAYGISLAAAPQPEAGTLAGPDAAPQASHVALALDQSASVEETLADLAARVRPLSRSTSLRHRIADATFCLPQNVVGILFYAFLELTGGVVATAEGGGVRLIVTPLPLGVSLGRYIVVGTPFLSDRVVSHELGHTAQSYRRGPFYLAVEGAASFLQAALALFSPSFARGYHSRWPESEADALGRTALLPPSS